MIIIDYINKIVNSANAYPKGIFSLKGKIYTCVNPYSYLILRKHPSILDAFDGFFIDGISMCYWIRWFWRKRIPRLSFDMTTMAKDLFEQCNKSGQTLYLLGSKSEQISGAIEKIKTRFPALSIVGFRNGYFQSEEERKNIIENIITLNPDFVIVGMGTPLQEIFLRDLKQGGYKGVAFTCGGFLHQTSEGLDYYPKWVDKYNLRGFYRQYKEKGIFKRNYDTFVVFPVIFLKDTIKSKLK